MPAHFHHVPGRLRVHVPGIKGNVPKAKAVEAYLSQLKGVFRVEGRPITGSLVIHYDASILDFQSLFAALPVEVPKSAARPSVPASTGITAKAARIAAGYAFDKAVEHGIPLLLKAFL